MATKIIIEQRRLTEASEAGIPWKKWGPYLSERQWGTVRRFSGVSREIAQQTETQVTKYFGLSMVQALPRK